MRAGAVPGSLDRESLFTYGCRLVVQDLTLELLLGPSSHGPRGRGQARRAGHKRSFGRGQRTLRPCLPVSASPAAVPPRPPANEVGKVQRNRSGSAETHRGCCSLGAEGTEGDAAGNLASRYPGPSDGNYPRAEAGGLRAAEPERLPGRLPQGRTRVLRPVSLRVGPASPVAKHGKGNVPTPALDTHVSRWALGPGCSGPGPETTTRRGARAPSKDPVGSTGTWQVPHASWVPRATRAPCRDYWGPEAPAPSGRGTEHSRARCGEDVR